MKTRLFFSVITIIFLGFAGLIGTIAPVQAQTVDDIINKHIDAIGGKASWEKVNSIKMSGSVTAQGMEIAIDLTAVQMKGARMNISMMGMTGYTIQTPTEGWVYMPFNGQQKPEAMTTDQIKAGLDDLDIQGDLIDYKAKGYTAELVGKEDMEGTECWKVKLNMKDGKVKTLFFDPDSYFLISEVDKMNVDGKEQTGTVNFSNFQKLPEGITMPMSIGKDMGDFVVKKIEINGPVADSVFKLPQADTKKN